MHLIVPKTCESTTFFALPFTSKRCDVLREFTTSISIRSAISPTLPQTQQANADSSQYRMNWVVDPRTGEYNTTIPSPTGIPSDPALASYGVLQSEQLATHLLSLRPQVDLIYSSPWYRCLQTLLPFTTALAKDRSSNDDAATSVSRIHVEPGVGEFFGRARFEHPSPAPLDQLRTLFPHLHGDQDPVIVPSSNGETIAQLHDRVAYCLRGVIRRANADPQGPRALLICTHAAVMIAVGRALTGRMPEDEGEDDFKCFTCSLSKYVRRRGKDGEAKEVEKWTPADPERIPDVGWRDDGGVEGGWKCEVDGDCSFLAGGEERGW